MCVVSLVCVCVCVIFTRVCVIFTRVIVCSTLFSLLLLADLNERGLVNDWSAHINDDDYSLVLLSN